MRNAYDLTSTLRETSSPPTPTRKPTQASLVPSAAIPPSGLGCDFGYAPARKWPAHYPDATRSLADPPPSRRPHLRPPHPLSLPLPQRHLPPRLDLRRHPHRTLAPTGPPMSPLPNSLRQKPTRHGRRRLPRRLSPLHNGGRNLPSKLYRVRHLRPTPPSSPQVASNHFRDRRLHLEQLHYAAPSPNALRKLGRASRTRTASYATPPASSSNASPSKLASPLRGSQRPSPSRRPHHRPQGPRPPKSRTRQTRQPELQHPQPRKQDGLPGLLPLLPSHTRPPPPNSSTSSSPSSMPPIPPKATSTTSNSAAPSPNSNLLAFDKPYNCYNPPLAKLPIRPFPTHQQPPIRLPVLRSPSVPQTPSVFTSPLSPRKSEKSTEPSQMVALAHWLRRTIAQVPPGTKYSDTVRRLSKILKTPYRPP